MRQPKLRITTLEDGATRSGEPGEELLRQALEQVPVAIAAYDRDLTFQWVNPAYAAWVGRPAADLVGRPFSEVFPGTEETVGATLRNVIATGQPFHSHKFSFVYQTPEGPNESFWDVRHLPQSGPDGEVIGALTIARDLTPQIDLEEEVVRHAVDLQESEARFRTMIDEAPIGIVTTDPQGRILHANQAFETMIGYRHPELRARSLAGYALPGELSPDQLLQLAGRKPSHGLEVRLRHRGGDPLWCMLSATAHRDFKGEVRFLTVMLENVTEARQSEEQRQQALGELQTFMETVPDILYALDCEGRLIRWNRRLEEVTGLTRAQLQGKKAMELAVEADRAAIASAIGKAFQTGYATVESRLLSTTGEPIPYHWTGAPLRDPHGQLIGMVGMGRDVTEIKRMEGTLREQYERLRELERLRGDFVNAVSHELRTPLTSIMGYAEFLEEELAGPLTAEQRAFVQQIQASSSRLDYLVSDLLDSARLEAGTFRLDCEEADLAVKVREIADSLQPQAQAMRLRLQTEVPDEPLVIPMDPRRIGQVLINLIGNAIKFSPPQGTIRVRLSWWDGEIRGEIEDQGIGIAPEDVPKLFQRFSQLAGGKRKKGTGLGLSISKAIVESHGGRIGVDSRPGEGSTFWFTLPAGASRAPGEERGD